MQNIDAKSLASLLDKDAVTLVDVREKFEYNSAHIANCYLVPLDKVSAKTMPKTNKPIALYCKLGKRSQAAAAKLLADNVKLKLYSLDGGIVAWQAAGLPVKRQHQTLPVERQTQICIGIIVSSSCSLGYFLNAKFYAIAAFMGFGLIFAGITGFCGLAKLIAKMPWNKN